jgi:hypothetical protein
MNKEKLEKAKMQYGSMKDMFEDPLVNFISNNEEKIINGTSFIMIFAILGLMIANKYYLAFVAFLLMIMNIRLVLFQKSLVYIEKLFEEAIKDEEE